MNLHVSSFNLARPIYEFGLTSGLKLEPLIKEAIIEVGTKKHKRKERV